MRGFILGHNRYTNVSFFLLPLGSASGHSLHPGFVICYSAATGGDVRCRGNLSAGPARSQMNDVIRDVSPHRLDEVIEAEEENYPEFLRQN